jgi:hypothetical protein
MRKIKREEKHPGRELFGSLPRTQTPPSQNHGFIIPCHQSPKHGLCFTGSEIKKKERRNKLAIKKTSRRRSCRVLHQNQTARALFQNANQP